MQWLHIVSIKESQQTLTERWKTKTRELYGNEKAIDNSTKIYEQLAYTHAVIFF
jgi:hypothetical protein